MTETMRSILLCKWDGEVFQPFEHQRSTWNRLVVGANYWLTSPTERSERSHNHYFACLKKAHDNLPETELRFPTPESFRKWLLIQTKQCTERSIVCANHDNAKELSSLIEEKDEYALVSVFNNTVVVWSAVSQSRKTMGPKAFQDSKQKVLEAAAAMIGITVDELAKTPEPA